MDITILGAGTAIPIPSYSPVSILLRSSKQEAFIDLGPGALQRAAKFGFDFSNLQTIFLTHLHPDHTLDLITFIQASNSDFSESRLKPLKIYGCLGTRNWFEKIMDAYEDILPTTYLIDIIENGKADWNWGELKVSTILTSHTKNSLAYRFEEKQRSFVFTGDTVFSDELVQFSIDADLLICECSFPAGWTTNDHMTANLVGLLASKANVNKLVITHKYPPAHLVDVRSQICELFSGVIVEAQDGFCSSV